MPATLMIAGRSVPLVVERRAGARGVRLRADAVQGIIRLGLPARGGGDAAAQLLAANHDWLAAQVARWPRPCPLVAGAIIPFDGGQLRIDWAAGHPRIPVRHGDRLHIGGAAEAVASRTRRWLRAAALADLEPATRALADVVARPVSQVRIGDPRARWGSCATATARIAYSWRLILAPAFVRRNVVAHEVAHLVHADHGTGFHALLARLDPHERTARAWLRAHGTALHWVDRDQP